jgi:hypothetical protein
MQPSHSSGETHDAYVRTIRASQLAHLNARRPGSGDDHAVTYAGWISDPATRIAISAATTAAGARWIVSNAAGFTITRIRRTSMWTVVNRSKTAQEVASEFARTAFEGPRKVRSLKADDTQHPSSPGYRGTFRLVGGTQVYTLQCRSWKTGVWTVDALILAS